jgi:hypothetical protein
MLDELLLEDEGAVVVVVCTAAAVWREEEGTDKRVAKDTNALEIVSVAAPEAPDTTSSTSADWSTVARVLSYEISKVSPEADPDTLVLVNTEADNRRDAETLMANGQVGFPSVKMSAAGMSAAPERPTARTRTK